MEKEIKRMLEEEIANEIDNLSHLTPGSAEHTAAIENLSKLYKLKIEETKNEKELSDAVRARESEFRLKREQLSEQVKDRYWRFGIEAGGIILPLVFYGIWMHRGFRFETEGTYTSKTFMNLFNRFRPSKN